MHRRCSGRRRRGRTGPAGSSLSGPGGAESKRAASPRPPWPSTRMVELTQTPVGPADATPQPEGVSSWPHLVTRFRWGGTSPKGGLSGFGRGRRRKRRLARMALVRRRRAAAMYSATSSRQCARRFSGPRLSGCQPGRGPRPQQQVGPVANCLAIERMLRRVLPLLPANAGRRARPPARPHFWCLAVAGPKQGPKAAFGALARPMIL